MLSRKLLQAIVIFVLVGLASASSAESMWDRFKDPEDGAFDMSEYLASRRGVGAGGFGFRYFLARLYGMHGGLDFAWSREDFAWYITVGSYWH